MSKATIRIPAPLRSFTAGADEVQVEGATVGEVIRELVARNHELETHLLDGDGQIRNFINVFVDDRNITALEGLDSSLSDGAVVHIVPAVAGGES